MAAARKGLGGRSAGSGKGGCRNPRKPNSCDRLAALPPRQAPQVATATAEESAAPIEACLQPRAIISGRKHRRWRQPMPQVINDDVESRIANNVVKAIR